MKYLPIIGFTIAISCVGDLAVAKTPAEIKSIAKAVTVEISLLKDRSIGSGIIIERKGDTYTLVTNRHVVCGKTQNCTTPPSGETYTVKLGDGHKYKVSAKSVKLLGHNLDLAIVQFRSNRAYSVAQVADPGSLKVGDAVYTSGYPAEPPGFSFNLGSAMAVVNKRLTEDRA
jgi:S1-C subfamily serine protease